MISMNARDLNACSELKLLIPLAEIATIDRA